MKVSIKRLALAMGRNLSTKELENLHEVLLDTVVGLDDCEFGTTQESRDSKVLDAFADLLDSELTKKKQNNA